MQKMLSKLIAESDPQTVELIKQELLNPKKKPFWELSIEENRKKLQESGALMRGPEEVDSVVKYQIKSENAENGQIPIWVYTPKGMKNDNKSAALLHFFSGGFVYGSIESQDPIARALCNKTNCKVFSVGYSLSPENRWPVAIHDACNAHKWLINNASILRIDPQRIAVSGYSSGGNLAALVAINARQEELPLAYQVLICPWLDLTCGIDIPPKKQFDEIEAFSKPMLYFLKNYLPNNVDLVELKNPSISPFWQSDLEGLAPALVITAEYDPLQKEGEKYADNLEKAGVKTIYSCYKGQPHTMLLWSKIFKGKPDPINEIGKVLQGHFYQQAPVKTAPHHTLFQVTTSTTQTQVEETDDQFDLN